MNFKKKRMPQQQRNAKDYAGRDQRTQIYMNPSIYVGSPKRVPREEWVYAPYRLDEQPEEKNGKLSKLAVPEDVQPKKRGRKIMMQKKSIKSPEAVERTGLEIFSNATDCSLDSIKKGVDICDVEFKMNKTEVSIKNGGLVFPIKKREFPQEGTKKMIKMWVIEASFGRINTSTNYDEDDEENADVNVIGKFGIGSKATNIFSKKFKVVVVNAIAGQKYTQIWSNNMKEVSEPEIEPTKAKESYVEVTYTLDFEKFGYRKHEYTEEDFQLFERHCIDFAYSSGIPIKFNERRYNIQSDEEYIEFYFGKDKNRKILNWKEAEERTEAKGRSKQGTYTPETRVYVFDTPNKGEVIGFVNGLMIKQGGTFVDEVAKKFCQPIMDSFNKESDSRIGVGHILPHVTFLINCKFRIRPEFTSLTKVKLQNQFLKFNGPSYDIARKVKSWDLITNLKYMQSIKITKKNDGKKVMGLLIKKAFDANLAGGPQSERCILALSEGDSGNTAITEWRDQYPEGTGKDFLGSLPLRGKGLSVRKMDFGNKKHLERYNRNSEITKIKQMLGLKEGVDYSDDANFRKLRYHKLWIFADMDDDGAHIISICLDFLATRYPGLLSRPDFVEYPLFPYVIIMSKNGKVTLRFYSMAEYKSWARVNGSDAKWDKPRFLKGLGSMDPEDVAGEYANFRRVVCSYGRRDEDTLRMAFTAGPAAANIRKKWMLAYTEPSAEDYDFKKNFPYERIKDREIGSNGYLFQEPIRHFLNIRLRQFSLATVRRCIPYLTSSLKTSQLDIVWGTLDMWKPTVGKKKYTLTKLTTLGAHCITLTHYEKGETSLHETLKKMSLPYIGKNNLPYYTVKGGTGSRENGEKICSAARYLELSPQWWLPYVFRNEDRPLLKMVKESGKELKPYLLRPILALVLINGARGAATGWSTEIPNFHPLDLVQWHLDKLRGKTPKELIPWYRHFKGEVEIKDVDSNDRSLRRPKKMENDEEDIVETMDASQEEDPDNEDDVAAVSEDADDNSKSENEKKEKKEAHLVKCLVLSGTMKREKDGSYLITELPVGRWTKPYVDSFKYAIAKDKKDKTEKCILRQIKDNSDKNNIKIRVWPREEGNKLKRKQLDLVKSKRLTNFLLLDDQGIPKKYKDATEILEDFHSGKLTHYKERKDYIVKKFEEEITDLKEKIRYIKHVIDKKLKVRNRPQKDIFADMDKFNFDHKLYPWGHIRYLSVEGLQELNDQLAAVMDKFKEYKEIPASQHFADELRQFRDEYKKRYGEDR